ncbi:MAG: hypothetical protein AB7O97_11200 [Planctomycetota bacterium]
MPRPLSTVAVTAAALGLVHTATAQNCYDDPVNHQCFSFAPPRQDASRLDTGLDQTIELASRKLKVTGDIRLRLRGAETTNGVPYAEADQQATRARVQLEFQVNERAKAFAEFNFSETWAGSESYSDALVGENFNKLSQAWFEVDDMFGFDDRWRAGRSNYVLSNGLVLGSCDFLQHPSTFTGVWASTQIAGHDLEVFAFDDYGPLQSMHPGARYAGATGRVHVCEDGLLQTFDPYFMAGTNDGDDGSDDSWIGAHAGGKAPWDCTWTADWALRLVDGGDDIQAYSVKAVKEFEDCWLRSVSFTRTDSEGAMHVNPADFNSAGLLHQYAGAWRSDLDTNQFGVGFRPGCGVDLDLNLLTLDRDGAAAQLGHFEADIMAGKQLESGVYVWAGYGFDNEDRQVGYFQVTLYF